MLNWTWLRRWLDFRRHDDAYARDRQGLNEVILTSIQQQQQLERHVWLVIHSESIYEQFQDRLGAEKLPYEIIHKTIDGKALVEGEPTQLLQTRASIKLIFAELIPTTRRSQAKTVATDSIAVFVLDRSEQIENDDRIEAFCRNIPFKTELGYFLALEDPLVQRVVDPMAMIVLEQMGLDQHDLITSNLITSRLNRKLRREQKQRLAE